MKSQQSLLLLLLWLNIQFHITFPLSCSSSITKWYLSFLEVRPAGNGANARHGFWGEAAQWAGLQARTTKRNGDSLFNISCYSVFSFSPQCSCFIVYIFFFLVVWLYEILYFFLLMAVVFFKKKIPFSLYLMQTLFKTLAISFSTMTLFTGITPLYGSSLQYAGPASLVWGWVVVSFFTWFVGFAMAEICSSFPVCTFTSSHVFSYH